MDRWAKEIVSFGINRSGMDAGQMDFAIPLHDKPPTLEQMRELAHLMMTAHGILMDRIRREAVAKMNEYALDDRKADPR